VTVLSPVHCPVVARSTPRRRGDRDRRRPGGPSAAAFRVHCCHL